MKAEGDAKAAQLYGEAYKQNTSYMELRRLEAAREIAKLLGRSNNKVYLDSETLLVNLTHGLDENLELKRPAHQKS